MNATYHGWIPILTHTLRPVNKRTLHQIEEVVFSDRDPSQATYIEDYKWDERGFLSGFFVRTPSGYNVTVDCKVQKTGLVSFSFSSKPVITKDIIEKNMAVNLFDFIRDVYHEHIHHHKDDDATLVPIKTSDEKDAITKILDQFSRKIFKYHQTLKSYNRISFAKKFYFTKKRLDSFESALGEFTYAQSFIDLHKNYIDNYEDVISSFERAFNSVAILREKLAWTLMFIISAILLILTAVMLISPGVDFLKWILGYILPSS